MTFKRNGFFEADLTKIEVRNKRSEARKKPLGQPVELLRTDVLFCTVIKTGECPARFSS